MGYWEGQDRMEAQRIAALPWRQRMVARFSTDGLPVVVTIAVLGASLAILWWRG